MRERGPRHDGVPKPLGRLARRRIDQNRPEQALPVGKEQGRYPESACLGHPQVLSEHLITGRRIGDGGIDQTRVEADRGDQLPGDRTQMRLLAVDVQCPADGGVPGIEVLHPLTSQQRADPHQRPAVGPLALPRMLLTLGSVDLFQAEEPPSDLEPGTLAHLADPQ